MASEDAEQVDVEVPALLGGVRLDRALSMLTGISRNEAATLITSGSVAVNGRTDRPRSHVLSEGDRLEAVFVARVGIVDQDVDLAQLLRGEFKGGLDAVGIGDLCLDWDRARAVGFSEVLGAFRGVVGFKVRDGDVGPKFGEGLAVGGSKVAGAARDENGLVFQAEEVAELTHEGLGGWR